jgi:hypothetical protein
MLSYGMPAQPMHGACRALKDVAVSAKGRRRLVPSNRATTFTEPLLNRTFRGDRIAR